MRLILFFLGLTLVCLAGYLGFQHWQGTPLAQAQAAPPSGPATQQLERGLTTAQSVDTASDPADAPAAALINLAPKRQTNGARFVKPPITD